MFHSVYVHEKELHCHWIFFKKKLVPPRVKAETEIILVSSALNIYSVHKIELAPCLVQNADCSRIRSGKNSALIIRSKSNLVQ